MKDDQCDNEADDRVGDRRAERDGCRADEDAEADEAVDAGVVSVGDQSWAVELLAGVEADVGGDLVAELAGDGRGWQSHRADLPDEDAAPILLFYCPACAEREFAKEDEPAA